MSKGIKLSPKYGVNPSVSVCFWCGKDVGVALMGKLPGDMQAPHRAILTYEPCPECEANFKLGIVMFEADEITKRPTGRYMVFTEEAVTRIFAGHDMSNAIKQKKFAVSKKVFDKLLVEKNKSEAKGEK